MKSYILLFFFLLTFSASRAQNPFEAPKREMRGAWIQCVNEQFQGMSREEMQANLRHQLDVLKAVGVNVVMFQVRAEADALYESTFEPWSRFLTGRQGKNPGWDPLAWMVEECHERGMELHAWINPFRAKTKGTSELSVQHPYNLNPDRFFKYDGLIIFDPGRLENQNYICQVAADIVRRYDVDGLHIDDYFYPYPAAGQPIPDDLTFQANRNGFTDKAEWRRYNVNSFIKMLYQTVHSTKPWVKFGVSPFGIYHNLTPTDRIPGSETKGLQNYDDLYADVLYWINQGWVDYVVPQLYWEIGHSAADYDRLVRWWAKHSGNRPLIIGQDVGRTVRARDLNNPTINQMSAKFELQRQFPQIKGSCLWYSAAVVRNEGNYAYELQNNYHLTPALMPLMPFIDDKAPRAPRKVKKMWMPDGYYLFWTAPKAKSEMDAAKLYVVYCFERGKKIDLNSSTHIMAVTPNTLYKLPYEFGHEKYTFVITALDRLHNESKPVKIKVKL
ncbi:hypothetical protein EII14_08475 [Alloprevotella sp. OH1205_COT-284]|uniref:glycoside hydrolase family 10 protein n=1 Tax=Alloprevotella sp. OH1205_COT-284 TaxID=2491043 RepID=UPI000F5E0FEB|nr:family 10 glycosylhydrolase [Alloprevotella sp. OH1205_COT-284]RRD75460.1 hypothetical protein EII14_08475 [Alloprevotella sp. OH1205_COT-284]